ncbi:hypothetical protein S83_055163, partial [Arachis hypogaea]
DALAPCSARNIKSYVEDNQSERIKENQSHAKEMASYTLVFCWHFEVRVGMGCMSCVLVMKYGNESQIDLIVAEVGGALGAASLEAQCELFNALIDGCTEAAELGNLDSKYCNQMPLLDFFGVPVKVNDLLACVQQPQLLSKRISRLQTGQKVVDGTKLMMQDCFLEYIFMDL